MTTTAERKRAQRERDKKAGLVRYERTIRPEWAKKLDKCLSALQKSGQNRLRKEKKY